MREPIASLHEWLDPIDQTHLLAHASHWSQSELECLLREIRHLDLGLLCRLQEVIRTPVEKKPPLPAYSPEHFIGSSPSSEMGKKALSKGRCGCIVLAGGQASRLRIQGPKGYVPLSLVKHKTLFQMIAEKVKAASKCYGAPLPLAFMLSIDHRAEIETFFFQHHFFGLSPDQVFFFSQPVWPLLSFSGGLVLQGPGKLAMGPNGNGDVFSEFVKSGLCKLWEDRGIDYVRVVPIDNPLARPFDEALLDFHIQHQCEVSIQGVNKRSASEKTGTFVQSQGQVLIDEYSSEPREGIANTGLFCFSVPFMKKVADVQLPLHPAQKAFKTIDDMAVPSKPNVWKLEKFIFDVLPFSEKTDVLVYPRQDCFAPLKNYEGEGNIADVQKSLLKLERKIFETVTGVKPPDDRVFELDSAFYYPTPALTAHWKGRLLPNEAYIEAS